MEAELDERGVSRLRPHSAGPWSAGLGSFAPLFSWMLGDSSDSDPGGPCSLWTVFASSIM